jgi:multicomponent K+:H+ antiporter subunit G
MIDTPTALPAAMTALPPWAALLTALLVLAGAAFTLIGCIGLTRFQSFYQRVHAPTLGTSLGTILTLIASMLYFSLAGGRLVIHEILIAVFVTVTTPVTLVLLVRASRYRDLAEGPQATGIIGMPDDLTKPADTAESDETKPSA